MVPQKTRDRDSHINCLAKISIVTIKGGKERNPKEVFHLGILFLGF